MILLFTVPNLQNCVRIKWSTKCIWNKNRRNCIIKYGHLLTYLFKLLVIKLLGIEQYLSFE